MTLNGVIAVILRYSTRSQGKLKSNAQKLVSAVSFVLSEKLNILS